MDKRAFVGVQEFSGGDITACCRSKKKSKIGQLEKSKEQLSFIHITPFPRWHSSMPRQPFSACDFIPTKVKVSELLSAQLPQLCRMLPEVHFSLTQPRILGHELYDWEIVSGG